MVDQDADVIGIGFGPSNIALAIALEEMYPGINVIFLEHRERPLWQPGMLLDGSDIQHNPVRDLVTLRNPRSRYSFINYLFEEGRLVEFLNLGLPFPLRKDYARYVTWAAEQLTDRVRFGVRARGVRTSEDGGIEVDLADGRPLRAKALVVAPGRPLYLPEQFRASDDSRIFHATSYLDRLPALAAVRDPRVVVVGASQSAAELVLDVSRRFPTAKVHNVVRGFGYRQKDLSPFHAEVYYPEFVDYYYDSSETAKADLDQQLRYTNYSAADLDVLDALNARLYEQRLDGNRQIQLVRNTEITGVRTEPEAVVLELIERHRGTVDTLAADVVILATGFTDLTDERGGHFLPGVLAPIHPEVARTPSGRAAIGRDYRVQAAPGRTLAPVHLNGVCETTHGLGDAGSFSLVSLRAATIADSLAKSLAV
jgi:L-ornithine N5-oxygenase